METPLVICGQDQTLPAPIPPARETVALAGDSRGFMPCPAGPHAANHREVRERAVVAAAAASADPELRRRAAAALGRMASPSAVGAMQDGTWTPGTLLQLLGDADARVRREAASAIGDALSGGLPEPRQTGPSTPAVEAMAHGRAGLEARLATEPDAEAAAVMLETLGRLRYGSDDAARGAVETVLAGASRGDAVRTQGAVKGLEALLRLSPKRVVNPATIVRLRELVATGATPRIRRLALLALQAGRNEDDATLAVAAQDADWQVRRLAALRIDLSRDALQAAGAKLSQDPAFQVRYEMVGALARYATTTQQCRPLVTMFDDAEPTVALRAIDAVPDACPDKSDIVRLLITAAAQLGRPESHVRWHRPAHAFMTLSRLGPDVAKGLLEAAEAHPVWQVRAAAATVAATIKADAPLVRLAGDKEPNVQNAAIEGLRRLSSPALAKAAIDALESDDYQLLRTSATALRGTAAVDRDRAVKALFEALFRIGARATDTSRDPRVAMLERLEELLPADRALEVLSFTGDFDRAVRDVATRIITAKTGKAPAPDDLRERYPYQPTRAVLAALPAAATLLMEGGGTITLELLGAEAPVTVARFAELARAGYYDGLTFHRVVPNFVIQGGSPGANEYAGAPRYMRDEPGTTSHLRGAVGISTRGRDTGDGQIFIDLVDLPRLDHDYTVFARVTAGMDVVDRILEGAKIARVTVK
jgi:cyclophilin family peptidyl-prolyl cis-trans isomerase/HEAT repeat protein